MENVYRCKTTQLLFIYRYFISDASHRTLAKIVILDYRTSHVEMILLIYSVFFSVTFSNYLLILLDIELS